MLKRCRGRVRVDGLLRKTCKRAIDDGTATPVEAATQAPAVERSCRIKEATPVALRLAQRHGIDAETLQGTGPGGRVIKEDVQRATDEGTSCPSRST